MARRRGNSEHIGDPRVDCPPLRQKAVLGLLKSTRKNRPEQVANLTKLSTKSLVFALKNTLPDEDNGALDRANLKPCRTPAP